MATYDYKCDECSSIYEIVHGMNEEPEPVCATCGAGTMHKHLTAEGCNIAKCGDGKDLTTWEEIKYRRSG